MNDFVTLVLHTPDRADRLREILTAHGIAVKVERWVAECKDASAATESFSEDAPMKVMIPVDSLQVALKVMESVEGYSSAGIEMKMAGMSGTLLIPVDFSSSSMLAVKVGFSMAAKIGIRPVLLHAYLSPLFAGADAVAPLDPEISFRNDGLAAQEDMDMYTSESRQLEDFKKKVKAMQAAGELPDLRFSSLILEGVPEEVILDYCKESRPMMVVMATRGVDRKEEDLVGSVTAEVLDSCRVPVFAVPENYEMPKVEDIKRLVMLCTLGRHDVNAVRILMQTFDYPACEVWLVPADEKSDQATEKKLSELRNFFTTAYPMSKFHKHPVKGNDFTEALDSFIKDNDIQLMIVPNRKTNVFSRIFRPSIAHKCLFSRDMPLLALPV